jgi:PAS domain S-box-containing protein
MGDTIDRSFRDEFSWADIPWGTHLCQFYDTAFDLLEVLVPYYAEGLGNGDCGVWVASPPISLDQARTALLQAVPDLDAYLARGQMTIVRHDDWYLRCGTLDAQTLLAAWLQSTAAACARGFRGLRVSGDAASLKDNCWSDLLAYEDRVQAAIGAQRMIALCTYPLARCTAAELLDVVRVHDYAIVRRHGAWESVESTQQKRVQQALRKHAEKALRESEERFRSVLEASPDAIARLDLTGRILLANQQAALLAGFDSVAQMRTQVESVFDLLAPEEHDRASAKIRELLEVGIQRDLEYCGVRRDGSRFPAEVSVALEHDALGMPSAMILVLRDVTQRKLAERELHEKRLQAVAASRAKSEFLTNMSHEIRTPMTSILGFSDLLMTPNLGPREQEEFLDGIRRNGEALLELLNAILDFSQIEADRVTLDKACWSLVPFVTDVIEAFRARAQAKGLRLERHFEPPLPETICTDEARLRQILINLLDNALKFTDQGAVRVTVRGSEGDAETQRVQFVISDTGIGIPAERLPDLFLPFMQVDGSATRRHGGVGLGLAIAQRLAEALGGHIEVTSQVGQGSTFRLTIDAGADDRRASLPAVGDLTHACPTLAPAPRSSRACGPT